jgi:6-pyruvoyltetrahydropterin/6-carboxytetrahydropterin synthase
MDGITEETWGLEIAKEYFKFSAAHFLIFPDGTTERLHGHNYRVSVELEAALGEHGLVIDFLMVKPIVRAMCDELDEHWLIPGEHIELVHADAGDGHTEVRYRDLRYLAPTSDVLVLPINNTSSENLATWFGRELRDRLGQRFPDVEVEELRVAVEETSGQRGIYRYRRTTGSP